MGVIVAVVIGIAVLTAVAVMLAAAEQPMSEEPVDRLDAGLPDGPIGAADIPKLRFRIGLRGYRMDDVDAALARIHASLAQAEGLDIPAAAAPAPSGPAAPRGVAEPIDLAQPDDPAPPDDPAQPDDPAAVADGEPAEVADGEG